jgi:asparagine synthase (glutamine-hydrolysing)
MYNLIMRLGVHQVMTPQLLAQVDLTAPLLLQQQVWQNAADCTPLNRELAYDWRFTLAESDLPKVRGATCVAGVEVGFPMLDERLLAFSQSLPSSDKLKGLQLRWFFKSALQGFLPEEIIRKKKQGFGLPFGVWANANAALRVLATDSLRSLAERGLVRSDFVKTLLGQKLPEHPGYFGEMVWILMMLEQWLRARAPNYRLP